MTHDVFVSHNNQDKPVARRVAHRLQAYGINVWLDERELRIGDELDVKIAEHIRRSGLVLVLASGAAARSAWVARELEFGISAGKTIFPLFIDDVVHEAVFSNFKGLDATDPHRLENVVLEIAGALAGEPLPEPSRESLEGSLLQLAREEPDIELLIDDCLHGEGLAYSHLETIVQIPFHPLDFALNAMYDLAGPEQRRHVANAAAYLFNRTGAGSYALGHYVGTKGNIDGVLNAAVARVLNVRDIDTALDLLAVSDPPHDQAFYGFLYRNCGQLNAYQKQAVVRMATHPERVPGVFGRDMAYAALLCVPDSDDLKQIWVNWINKGLSDGRDARGCAPRKIAYYINRAFTEEGQDWARVVDTLVRHVGGLLREPVVENIESAADHLFANVESPFLPSLIRECEENLAEEWGDWERTDEVRSYVLAVIYSVRESKSTDEAYELFLKHDDLMKAFNASRLKD